MRCLRIAGDYRKPATKSESPFHFCSGTGGEAPQSGCSSNPLHADANVHLFGECEAGSSFGSFGAKPEYCASNSATTWYPPTQTGAQCLRPDSPSQCVDTETSSAFRAYSRASRVSIWDNPAEPPALTRSQRTRRRGRRERLLGTDEAATVKWTRPLYAYPKLARNCG